MTEKRFIDNGYEAIEEQSFTDTETDKTYYADYFDEIIDLANGLNEKNKVLYKEIGRLKTQNNDLLFSNANNMELLKKENQQLKFQNSNLMKEIAEYSRKAKEIDNEKEQLKQELKIYRNVANCGNCKYHNYDWYDDGDEFEVCEKGNDMSDMICEEWEEL